MDKSNFIGCAIIYRLLIFSALLPQMHFRNRCYTWSGDFDDSVKLLKIDRELIGDNGLLVA
jgi:hypothetical protein